MKLKHALGAAIVAAISGSAQAESLNRNSLPLDILWESGSTLQFSLTAANPKVSAAPAGGTGSVLKPYTTLGFAYKQQLNDKLALAVFVNQPFGALGEYNGGPLNGYSIDWKSNEIAAVLKLKFDNNVSVYGGLRAVQSELNLALPAAIVPPGGYKLATGADVGFGYLVGAAYEMPERGLRVGLTYNSSIAHEFNSSEFGTKAFGKTKATLPQSVTLDAQMALNSKTLLFGSVQWSEYSKFDVKAPGFATLVVPGASVIDYKKDSLNAEIGLGRKINDEWSVFGIVDWTSKDGQASRLRPYDGAVGLALGGVYESGQIKVTGGVQFKKFGDATVGTSTYTGSTAVTPFVSVGYSF